MNKNKERDILENYQDWVATKVMNDEFIQSYSERILAKPKFVLSKSDSEFDKERLYSSKQMIEMFRFGFLAMSRTDMGQKILAKKKTPPPNPYPMIREMNVGETLVFPYNKWNSVRSAASTLKSQFGSTFHVRKLTLFGQVGDIEIVRLT